MGGGLSAYQAALNRLFVRTTGVWRLGLERTLELLDVLGNPHRRLRCIHVAGTNGKGSVCAMLDAVLQTRGFRVARYTSPHLVDFRERMLVGGMPLAEHEIVEFIDRWFPTIERIGATFFEVTTAMAFDAFARAEVDIAVIEVGLGGRLDATNVIDPLVAAVTSVDVDHTEWLGATVTDIAREKAGVFKPGQPAVIGETDTAIASLLERLARDAGATPVSLVERDAPITAVFVDRQGTVFTQTSNGRATQFHLALVGAHQARNAATALRILDVLPDPWRVSGTDAVSGLERCELPGRFQRVGRFIFDVAHNPAGMRTLVSALAAVEPPRPRVAVLSVLNDKDWHSMLDTLSTAVDSIILTTAPTSPAARQWDLEAVRAVVERVRVPCVHEPDFDNALIRAQRDGATVVITGSFHTVGDAMSRLHVSPLPE